MMPYIEAYVKMLTRQIDTSSMTRSC